MLVVKQLASGVQMCPRVTYLIKSELYLQKASDISFPLSLINKNIVSLCTFWNQFVIQEMTPVSLSLCVSFSHSLFYLSLSLSLSYTHTHTLTHTHSPSYPLCRSDCVVAEGIPKHVWITLKLFFLPRLECRIVFSYFFLLKSCGSA
jgi:hypothetical protein